MFKRIWFLAAAAAMMSSPAFALFEVHGLVGKRWYQHDNDGASQATILNVDAFLTLPIPLVTLGFGPGLEYNLVNEGDVHADSVDSATITKLAVKAMVGLSLVGTGLDVYGKLGYNVWSQGEYKGSDSGVDFKTEFETPGTNLALGIRYSLVPLVGLLFEAHLGQEKMTEIKSDGIDYPDNDAKSTAMLVGVNVGI